MDSHPFAEVKKAHLTGIKGVAMTALAQCFADLGIAVDGSDLAEDFVTKQLLDNLHVRVKDEFHESNIDEQTDLLVFTAAHKGSNNPEVIEAKRRSIPTLSHGEALGKLMNGKIGISICGVGGKSTTSAMVTWILEKTGRKPSFAVGVGGILGMERTGKFVHDSEHFVAEADEYATDPGVNNEPRFLHQYPGVIVCTNIAFDHPDIYASLDETKAAYFRFFEQLPQYGSLVCNGDDKVMGELLDELRRSREDLKIITVGEGENSVVRMGAFSSAVGNTRQAFQFEKNEYTVLLTIPGQFNAKNALYAIAACQNVGVPMADSIKALESFQGTMRRFENKGEKNGVQFYDDYAHHPTEIQATLRALREWYPQNKITAVFQPHTYSRTKQLLAEFSKVFTDADQIYLLDIFASAREADDPTISSDILAQSIANQGKKVENLHSIQGAIERLKTEIKPGNVVMTLGAGDLYHLHDQW
ncbi:MAG TPA: UDP-N-acetylmuramate--L-alanine ligase [Candidatus Saccharimonadia bacterium]|nr:UDP-N-acetylmuramate--L-alanine ligase [Candidatus Saccharimonadia bacterium]